jgi:hypothetical protein
MSGGAAWHGYGSVRIEVCCNDGDNGLFAGRALSIHLSDVLELSASDWRGPAFREFPDAVKISRRRFPIVASKDWYGNWCWNAYWMDAPVAADLLAYVHGQGTFGCEMGEERMFSRWQRPEPLSEHDQEFFIRQAVKAQLSPATLAASVQS